MSAPGPGAPEPTPEGIAAWVAAMPPARRMRMAAAIADTRTAARMTRIRQDTAWAETRTCTRAEAAVALGVSVRRLGDMISARNRRARGADAEADAEA